MAAGLIRYSGRKDDRTATSSSSSGSRFGVLVFSVMLPNLVVITSVDMVAQVLNNQKRNRRRYRVRARVIYASVPLFPPTTPRPLIIYGSPPGNTRRPSRPAHGTQYTYTPNSRPIILYYHMFEISFSCLWLMRYGRGGGEIRAIKNPYTGNLPETTRTGVRQLQGTNGRMGIKGRLLHQLI